MFRVYAVIGREMPPYKTMMEDAALMLRLLTAGQMCFYTLLFSVKMSLLTLYRKLLAGLPSIYSKVWWGIVAFCIVVSIAKLHLTRNADDTGMDWKCSEQHLHMRQFEREILEGKMWRDCQ